jgi:antitoxin CptB
MRDEKCRKQQSLSDATDLSRLRWRCRRGMRELDQLLARWLERDYPNADAAQRAVFEKLLACEDDQLWRWFIGRETPDEKDLDELVGRILTLPA